MKRLTGITLAWILWATAAVSPSAVPGREPSADAPTPSSDVPAHELPTPPGVPASVTVGLDDGVRLSAVIDAKTDDATLWLRFELGTATILRGVAWSRIQSAEVDGQSMTPAALRQAAPRLRSVPVHSKPAPARRRTVIPGSPAPLQEAEDSHGVAIGRVRSIRAEAQVAHWSSNTEPDGIRLAVWPLDRRGRVVPISGTLEVTLIGDQRSAVFPQPPDLRKRFSRIGSWNQSLEPSQLSDAGPAVFELSFQAVHPEFDRAVGNYGLLQVRLVIAGEGVFETSVSDLRIRPVDNYRDQLQNATGRRYLPDEQVGRSAPGWSQW